MAKRRNKQSSRSQKESAGCMWGLINMFGFRQGHSTQKLLLDRKHGNGRHVGTGSSESKLNLLRDSEDQIEDFDDVDENGAGQVTLGTPSVKALMEKEMSRARISKRIPSDELERIQSDLGIGIHAEKNNKKSSKNHKVAADIPVYDMKDASYSGTHQSNCPNPSEITPFDCDLASFMVDFYANKHQYGEEHADNKVNLYPSQQTDVCRKHDHFNELDSELAQKHSIIQKALSDVAEVLLRQKLTGAKSLTDNRAFIQSKEFMDALEVLSSNKDLYLTLLQDPNSFLLKHVQGLQNAETEKPSEISGEEIGTSGKSENSVNHKLPHKQSGYSLFRRKDKSKEMKPSKGGDTSQALNRIVILKPSPARIQNAPLKTSPSSSPQSNYSLNFVEEGGKPVSHFSLREIKRRLRHAIGENRKERHLISMDAVLHRIPYGSKDLGMGKASCNLEHASQASIISKRRDKKTKAKDWQPNIEKEIFSEDNYRRLNMIKVAHPVHREHFLYEEAKKRLAAMLDSGDQKEILPKGHISKPLGRILSLPDYNLLSPRLSPGRDTLSPREVMISPKLQFKHENIANSSSPQNLESLSHIDGSPDDESQVVDSRPALETEKHEAICIGEDLNTEGSTEIVNIEDNIWLKERGHLEVPSESSGNEVNVTLERCSEEEPESSTILEVRLSKDESQQIIPAVSTPPCSLLIHKVEAPESIMEKSDRPSPVSVLEPFFVENTVSPECTLAEPAELVMQPEQLHFGEDTSAMVLTSSESVANQGTHGDKKEARFEYIRTILVSSGLCCDELSERWHSSDLSLDPSLFEELGVSNIQLPEDPKILFDCINEVLVEIQEKFFSCIPWVALIRTCMLRIPKGGDVIQEVCKKIDWHLQVQFPRTLDQIVGKDLDGGSWMHLLFETEYVVSEMGDAILEYIMEETILELWE